MTKTKTVIEHVRDLGRATKQEVAALCPDLNIHQVERALLGAVRRGYVYRVDWIPRAGSPLAVFAVTEAGAPAGKLMPHVVAVIKELGRADADLIGERCPGFTRRQILKAIHNARQYGLIEKVGVAPKVPGRRARRLTVYAVTGAEPTAPERDRPLPPRGKYGHLGKVSSVFAMGAGLGA